LTFLLSPLADNLTSALLMATIAQAVCRDKKFLVLSFVNIVVAANAGGAWSPFGDITTLMVWTSGKVKFFEFSLLVLPSVINWLVPALIMSFFLPAGSPEGGSLAVKLKKGAKTTIFFGILTIVIAISFHNFLHLPPFLGMMLGLGILMFASFFSKKFGSIKIGDSEDSEEEVLGFDVFKKVEKVEFDTLFFFFGVLTSVGALQYIGYLSLVGESLYGNLGPTVSNIIIGLVSAIGDNIPVMYSVLKIDPAMGLDQWLLITLTAGVGGSLLSIGSAAGVAVMGVNTKEYTFLAHLKWTPVIFLGYVASITCWWYITQYYVT
ncbi:MAG: Na+/H+ antiporter NhaD/arsenite permease-like protein, partial [Chlamydiales bacterium]